MAAIAPICTHCSSTRYHPDPPYSAVKPGLSGFDFFHYVCFYGMDSKKQQEYETFGGEPLEKGRPIPLITAIATDDQQTVSTIPRTQKIFGRLFRQACDAAAEKGHFSALQEYCLSAQDPYFITVALHRAAHSEGAAFFKSLFSLPTVSLAEDGTLLFKEQSITPISCLLDLATE